MKLRNKRTGDIWEFDDEFSMKASQETAEKAGAISGSLTCFASSLAELNEEWEDVEEPKSAWYINEFGTVEKTPSNTRETLYDKARKRFGNYFETKEEAEKAVEKLKAWKRLRDKGFRFYSVDYEDQTIVFEWANDWLSLTCGEQAQAQKDLKLLFGGRLFGR